MPTEPKTSESMEQIFVCLENLGYVFPKDGDIEEPLTILDPPPTPDGYRKPALVAARGPRGHRRVKTPKEVVEAVRTYRKSGAQYKEIKEKFGISVYLIHTILTDPDYHGA